MKKIYLLPVLSIFILYSMPTEASDNYLPIPRTGANIAISYTPVTNKEFSEFLQENERYAAFLEKIGQTPQYSADEAEFPVTGVSYNDAEAYCEWLSKKDKTATYRLPTEKEWELAAGPMPKNAAINCGENSGVTAVDAYEKTVSASGAIDMWGNVWEWTSTQKRMYYDGGDIKTRYLYAVKGCAWNMSLSDCRAQNKKETRDSLTRYDDVGFRVIRENKDKQ